MAPDCPDMRGFDPVRASESELLAVAPWLEGKTLGEIAGASNELLQPSSDKTKGVAAYVYERFFNIEKNSDPGPDFAAAGIELKSTGLRRLANGGIGQKERLSLKQMGGFDKDERWEFSRLRKKLDNLLVIYYLHDRVSNLADFVTLRVVRWSPNEPELALLRVDWESIQRKWGAGRPLSESDTRVLGAATKDQKRGKKPASGYRRAYALKSGFNHSIYLAAAGLMPPLSLAREFDVTLTSPGRSELVAEATTSAVVSNLEGHILLRLRAYQGRTVADVRAAAGLPPLKTEGWKSAQATAVRALVGLPVRGRSEEAERYGLDVKTVPTSPDGTLWENMSFPRFDPMDLVDTTWNESDLLHQLNRLVIVPLVRPTKGASRELAILGRAFAWSPGETLLGRIRTTWESYRTDVAAGRPNDYPRESDDQPVFVNSHGQNRKDTIAAPGRQSVMKRSFWLHPDVLTRAIVESHPNWTGAAP